MNEFKSQICTSIEQSKRLLDLGLKPETADCFHWNYSGVHYVGNITEELEQDDIPAWSLHRLMEILDSPLIEFNVLSYNPYKEVIDLISVCVKLGCITNKEYFKL